MFSSIYSLVWHFKFLKREVLNDASQMQRLSISDSSRIFLYRDIHVIEDSVLYYVICIHVYMFSLLSKVKNVKNQQKNEFD